MLNRPAHSYRAAAVGCVVCAAIAALAAVVLVIPDDPRHRDEGPGRGTFAWIAGAGSAGAVACAAAGVVLRRRARAWLAAETARTGAPFYDLGFAPVVAGTPVGGPVVLSGNTMYVLVPDPTGSVAAQAKWDAIVPRTIEYAALPQQVRTHPEWPRADAKPEWRALVLDKANVRLSRDGARTIVAAAPAGRTEIQVDPFTRELVEQRLREMGWELPPPAQDRTRRGA